jgi:hypothetical protein
LSTPAPKPRAYPITGPGNPLPYKRNSYYRWERMGLIKLKRIGGKTLITAETVDAILSGEIAIPEHVARKHRPEPKTPRKGRPRKTQAVK